jgi:erythromycin esterase-like protein
MSSGSAILYPWRENAAYDRYTIPFYIKDGNRSLFSKMYPKGFPFADRLQTEYEQRILLPEHKENKGEIKIESKGENITSLIITIDGIGDKEQILYSDILVHHPDSILTMVSREIPLSGIELLNIRLYAEGKVGEQASITFSKLDILVGEKSIDQYPLRHLAEISENINLRTIPIKEFENKILEKTDNKILAFGESVHNNIAIRDFTYEFIRKQVYEHNCKLVILEIPLEKSLAYNRYIQDSDYELEEDLYLKEKKVDVLLDTLRKYNLGKKTEDKVSFLGMDYTSLFNENQNTAIDIFDYLVTRNHKLKAVEIDDLMIHLINNKDWSEVLTFMEEHKSKLEEYLSIDDYNCIKHILTLSGSMGANAINRFIKRDSVMFENTKFFMNNFAYKGGNIIICSHAIHTNIISTYPAVPCTPFGKYMKDKYKQNYISLLILTGQGEVRAFDGNYNRKVNTLSSPPKGSVEYYLSSLKKGDLYMPLTSELDHIVLSRFKGSHHISQEFFPFNLYERYQGLFFIEKKTNQPDNKIESDFQDNMERFKQKNKERKMFFEELKKHRNIN